MDSKFDDFKDPANLLDESKPREMSATARLPWWQLIQRVGRVVAIQHQLNCRVSVGTLQCIPTEKPRDSGQPVGDKETGTADWNFARFVPTDSRIPRMIIPKAACPQGRLAFF